MADLKQLARDIFERALADCSIERALARTLHVDKLGLLLMPGAEPVDLAKLKRVRILALGKAAVPMVRALLKQVPLLPGCELKGVLIAPDLPFGLPGGIEPFVGGHPVPNQASFDAASAALSMLRSVANDSPHETLCVFLISGGGSSMMELPLDPTISLKDTVAFHRGLVGSGATIVEMNCVRKHFSAIKGGRLALAAGSARKVTLLVSDVPPANLDALASGPTIPDPTTVAGCQEIVHRYKLLERFPESVRRFFQSDIPESPKPGQLSSPFWKLLDSDELALAAQRHAADMGFHTVIDNACDDWDYARAADYLLERIRTLRRERSRICLISCGEVTVQLPAFLSSAASGGRNQQFALYAATRLAPADHPLAVLSAGSDGIDGNSQNAGAVVDDLTCSGSANLSAAQEALASFESASVLSNKGATITTGPTGQNLRDLRLLLAEDSLV